MKRSTLPAVSLSQETHRKIKRASEKSGLKIKAIVEQAMSSWLEEFKRRNQVDAASNSIDSDGNR